MVVVFISNELKALIKGRSTKLSRDWPMVHPQTQAVKQIVSSYFGFNLIYLLNILQYLLLKFKGASGSWKEHRPGPLGFGA